VPSIFAILLCVVIRDRPSLLRRAEELRPCFRDAQPFPHVIVDDLFDDEALSRVVGSFPSFDEVAWYRYDNALERKHTMPHVEQLAPEIRIIFRELDSPDFVRFLNILTGVSNLQPDISHVGAGLHQILPGGSLAVHADSNYHPETGLDRRVNVLVFLNEDWKESYGGHLELWDADMRSVVRRILPVFNRTVIFACNDNANHGHPEPLACPPDRSRRSLAAYYYTRGRPPVETNQPHSTIYKRRPQDPVDPDLDALRRRRALGRL
jgi:hypothetical protein